MKAIETKYLGPTNTKGARIKAFDNNGNSLTISWGYHLNPEDNHRLAAANLAVEHEWRYERIVSGSLKNTIAHILVPKWP